MPNPNIGQITCPSCDFEDAAVRQSVKGKVYIVCEECGYQGFARGDLSNDRIRKKMRPCAVELPPEVPQPAKVQPKTAKQEAAPAVTSGSFGNWLGL